MQREDGSALATSSLPSFAKPERGFRESVVVADLLLVDLPIEFVVTADVEQSFAGDTDAVMALDHLHGHVALLLQRLNDAVRHEKVRIDLPFYLFLRHSRV